jgi:hypothetical protein
VRPAEVTGGRLGLFADCLLIGLLAGLTALPVVTAYPALVVACAAMRERVAADRSVGPRAYLAHLRAVAATGVAPFAVPSLVLALLALDAVALAAGAPGGAALVVAFAVAVAVSAVLALRTAAAWRPGTPWRAVVRGSAARARTDPGGDALLLLAAGAAVGIAFAVPVTALFMFGPLSMAAVAVDARAVDARP